MAYERMHATLFDDTARGDAGVAWTPNRASLHPTAGGDRTECAHPGSSMNSGRDLPVFRIFAYARSIFPAFVFLVAIGALLSGCAGVTVKSASIAQRFAALDRSALNSDRPSEPTLAFLKQHDLAEQYNTDPQRLIQQLDAMYQAEPGLDSLLALIELSHLQAKRNPALSGEAAEYDLACVVYAYLFLFDAKVSPPSGYLLPNTRLASAFYNRSLARYLLHARSAGIRFRPDLQLTTATASLQIRERQNGLPVNPEDFSEIHLAFEYAVSGLDVTNSMPGLGVPLILVHDAGTDQNRSELLYLPRTRQIFAATIFLRIETTPSSQGSGRRLYRSRLEIYDPMRSTTLQIENMTVPLETDTTTPLAWMAAHGSAPQGIKGLMDPEALKPYQGLFMLQPFEKDKIPVVFVHGLISSPLTWLPMINGLMGDPELRKHYQFWYFSYPTGNPVLYSASLLRESLETVRKTFDPDGTSPALRNMLIVGHSMGGLLAKYMVQDCGDQLWKALSTVAPAQLPVSPDVRQLVDKVFFFKPVPSVTEAVFIATPHRGSAMALGTIGKIGKALVTLPFTLAKASASLLGSLTTLGQNLPIKGVATGIDGLSPKNPVLTTSADLPVAVPFHSIIGNEDKANQAGGSDGIVPYWSSHLDGAQSELIVKSGHAAHEHPLAIREVRRIMLDHLKRSGDQAP